MVHLPHYDPLKPLKCNFDSIRFVAALRRATWREAKCVLKRKLNLMGQTIYIRCVINLLFLIRKMGTVNGNYCNYL